MSYMKLAKKNAFHDRMNQLELILMENILNSLA